MPYGDFRFNMNLYEKVKPYLKEEWRNDCFRGYTGQWKIENGKLYLTNLFHGTSTSPLPLDSIFGIIGKQPIEASWFSGKLHLVRGGTLIVTNSGIYIKKKYSAK